MCYNTLDYNLVRRKFMNFEALQMLVKSLLANFRCNFCSSWITVKDIDLLSIEWNQVSLEIHCQKCSKKSLVKSEVVSVDLSKMNLTSGQMTMIKNTIDMKNWKKIQNAKLINDSFIVELDKNLKKEKCSVIDLFE